MARSVVIIAVVAAACGEPAPPEPPEVFIPAGEFRVGVDCDGDRVEADCSSSPRDRRAIVRLEAFHVDRNLVTQTEYLQCVRAGVCVHDFAPLGDRELELFGQTAAGRYSYSLADVRHEHATAYCRWRGGRLLTPDEFERIARGTDGRKEPWGEGRSPCPDSGPQHSRACLTYKGPAGVRAVAYNRQWVDLRNKLYPAGMYRGDSDVTFTAGNMEGVSPKWEPLLYASFRCARSAEASPPAARPSMSDASAPTAARPAPQAP